MLIKYPERFEEYWQVYVKGRRLTKEVCHEIWEVSRQKQKEEIEELKDIIDEMEKRSPDIGISYDY